MDTLQPVRDVLRTGDKTKAQELIEQVIRISPSAEAYYLYALVGHNAATINNRLQMALQYDPGHAPALALQQRIEQAVEPEGDSVVLTEDALTRQAAEAVLEAEFGVPEPVVQRRRASETNVYEMLWDCQFCGAKGNLGLTHRFCPNCGAPQNPDTRYFPSDEDKVAVHDHKFVGVDVICPNCGELNGAASEFCGQCGTPLTEGAKKASTLGSQVIAAGQAFASSGSRDVVKEQFDSEMQRIGVQSAREKPKRGGFNIRSAAIIGIIVAAVGVIGFLFSRTEEVTVTVTGHTWERSIQIEEYRGFTTRSWRDAPPAGDNVSIRLGSCDREVRSYNQVPDGQECNRVRVDQGDGTFREEQQCRTTYRQEPVYDDMCTWTGLRWEDINPALGTGNSLAQSPAWPVINLNECDTRREGCQREAGRSENYIVIFDGEYRCSYSQAVWEDIPVGAIFTGQIRSLTNDLLCATLEQQ